MGLGGLFKLEVVGDGRDEATYHGEANSLCIGQYAGNWAFLLLLPVDGESIAATIYIVDAEDPLACPAFGWFVGIAIQSKANIQAVIVGNPEVITCITIVVGNEEALLVIAAAGQSRWRTGIVDEAGTEGSAL